MSVPVRVVVACLLASLSFDVPARAAGSPTPEGCYPMLVMSVVDGDTVYGYIDTSDPQVAIRAKLRLEGIDTPEIGSHAQCPEEKAMGAAARDFLRGKLYPSLAQPTRTFARACNIAEDKYGGRRVGRLEAFLDKSWVDLSELMVAEGLAFRYDGGKRGTVWCDCLTAGQCPADYKATASAE
jgi:endonuclease YncB( thermonuclease family)